MVPLCFHLYSGLCRGQISQPLHNTCGVCCYSLVLLLQDKHKEMALHWAHLCTQSAHSAHKHTLRLCHWSKLYCTHCISCNVCVSAVNLIHDLFRNTWGCGQAVKVSEENSTTAAFLPVLQKQEAHLRGDRKCLGAWLPVVEFVPDQTEEEGGVWSSVTERRRCGLDWEIRTVRTTQVVCMLHSSCLDATGPLVFQLSAFWHDVSKDRMNKSKWR